MDIINKSKDYLESNTLISKISFIILIIICFVILFNIGYWIISMILSPSRTPVLIDGMKDAKVPLMIPQALNQKNAKPIYRSDNQYNGLEFTWSVWFYINDPTNISSNSSNYSNIFVKGSTNNNDSNTQFVTNCPGAYLQVNTGEFSIQTMNLIILMDIFPYKDPITGKYYYNQTITIDNIPIKKWVNLIIRCSSQNVVDIFINGTLTLRVKLYNTVKQNYDNVYVSQGGGFDGFISDLKYFNYNIGTFEINQIINSGPNLKTDKDTNLSQSNPYYLSTRWLFNETTSVN